MKELSNFETAAANIYANMNNAFFDEEERAPIEKVDLGNDGNKLFTAELLAMAVQYKKLVGKDCDLIDFVGILNRMAFQYLLDDRKAE